MSIERLGAPGSFLRDQQLQAGLQLPIEITRAELDAAKAAKTLVPDTLYKVTDRGDAGVYLRSISNDEMAIHGTGFFLTPRYYGAGESEGNNWIGYWSDEKTANVGDLAIWPQYTGSAIGSSVPSEKRLQLQEERVWRNKTGSIGTSTDTELDATNWEPVERSLDSEFYLLQRFLIEHGAALRPGIDDVD
jgi:hypothetical protein